LRVIGVSDCGFSLFFSSYYRERETCQRPAPLSRRLLKTSNNRGGVIMFARIYKPAKTAMQSARAKTKEWVLEYEPATPQEIEPLMGWTSSDDMLSQVRLSFETKEEAIDYAQKNGIPFRIFEPHPRAFIKKAYADNFKFGRIGSWTH